MGITLARIFPDLPFAKVADEWIQRTKDEAIVTQMLSRRIILVELGDFLFGGGDVGCILDGGGGLSIRLAQSDTMDDRIEFLGHELGHTFHYNLKSCYPLPDRLTFLAARSGWLELQKMTEQFCDVFAFKWLSFNGRAKVEHFCRQLPFFA